MSSLDLLGRCLPVSVVVSAAVLFAAAPAPAATFNVNSNLEDGDVLQNDGVCATAAGACTLRAAIDEANAHPGMDTINIPAGTYPVRVSTGNHLGLMFSNPLVILDHVNIVGAGPGLDGTIIEGALGTNVMDVVTAETLVVDNMNDSVVSFEHDGTSNNTFIGSGSGGLDLAQRVVVAPADLPLDGDVLVATLGAGVLRYNGFSGAFVGTLVPSVVNGEPLLPGGMDFAMTDRPPSAPLGELYVSNFLPNGDVLRFAADGTFIGVFIQGGGNAQLGPILWNNFTRPTQGPRAPGLLVAVTNQDVIRRYNPDGTLVGTFASVPQPRDMVLYDGTLYVSSEDLDAIYMFDAYTGASQGWLVQPGGEGVLDGPTFMSVVSVRPSDDVPFTPSADIAVLSQNTNQILRFDAKTGAFMGANVQGGNFFLGSAGPFAVKYNGRNGPTVNISGITIANGHLVGGGSNGLSVPSGAFVALFDCAVRDNTSTVYGGGIGNKGALTLTRVAVTGNDLPDGCGGVTSQGGGIYNAGSLTVRDSLIADNFAGKGGGISNEGPNAVTEIVNSTISGNRSNAEAGGVRNSDGGAVAISFATIAFNRTNEPATCPGTSHEPNPFGGGIFTDVGFVHVGNTIIANNTDNRVISDTNYAPDCYSPDPFELVSQRNNIVGVLNTNCHFVDFFWGDGRFIQSGTPGSPFPSGIATTLANNGGPTLTHMLQPGSAAIDGAPAGTTGFFSCGQVSPGYLLDHDQRLQPRNLDGNGDGTAVCDIGAVEARPTSALDLDGDGIENSVDAAPSIYSLAFHDVSGGGSTTGSITSTGEQFLTITNATGGGVTVSAAASGGAEPAVVSACGGAVTVQIGAGQSQTITCVTANAGPDQIVECASGGTTPVTLNGSASSAAGGPPSFSWSVPGVTLQNPNQAIASGGFPIGTKTATLTVTRGVDTATDTALVTVLDSKAPVLLPPPDITVPTCTSVNIGQAAAADACGGSVTISNNAPSSFKAGVYTVTWRATDQFGNEAVKTQKVTVGLGDNSACCPAGTNIINGTSNNNTLNGTTGADCILGKGGQDTINGMGGNDFIGGGDGNDIIDGGSGNDFVEGGTGQDTVRGGTGNDTVLGMDGDDFCYGGDNDDTVRGGQGQDKLFGENGNDALFGDIGDDTLDGGAGNDTLDGGGLHDTCAGGSGTNTFFMCQNQPGSFGPLSASFAVTDDWGTGFCVGLSATNPGASLAQSWGVTFNLSNATIYTSWNGLFGGSTGTVTMLPSMSWNQTLDPGETDGSIGFCANRTAGGSPPPNVLSTRATF